MPPWTPRHDAYLIEHPDFATALADFRADPSRHNTFVHNVVTSFERFGSLSEAQRESLVRSVNREREFARDAAEPKGDAPVGRQTVTGIVLALKEKTGKYGDRAEDAGEAAEQLEGVGHCTTLPVYSSARRMTRRSVSAVGPSVLAELLAEI